MDKRILVVVGLFVAAMYFVFIPIIQSIMAEMRM